MINNDFFHQPTMPGIKPETSQQQETVKVPEAIGKYKVESFLSKGGMSILYLGTHPETKDPIIIKVLSPKFLSNPDVVQRFTNEAEIIAMTKHPNIVQMYGYGEWEGGFYIAMEYIPGTSLRQYILQTPISLSRALEIIIDIAYALCHLHAHGVIHRDLKPENILITEKGEIKVIDFGISQLLKVTPEGTLQKSQLLGTPIYMSPEQRENPESVSFPSDIYSLGIIAYELILGKLSHGQIHLSLMPKGMQRILQKTLQPESDDRYQDVVDFIAEVSAYKNSTTLQKEKKATDSISELAESMRAAQMALIATTPPSWPEMEIGFIGHQAGLAGIFHDFFEIPQGAFGFVAGESSSKSVDGIIKAAVLRGMLRSLCRIDPTPLGLMTLLNEIIINDKMNQTFFLNYLYLNPSHNEFRYISCSYGNLWKISTENTRPEKIISDNPPLGESLDTQFCEIQGEWREGEAVIVHACENRALLSEQAMESLLQDEATRTPQKQVEALIRKMRISSNKLFQECSVAFASFLRKH